MKGKELTMHAAAVAAEAFVMVGVTTVLNHRQETHRSLQLDPTVEQAARDIMRMTGVEPSVWAAVHTIHHGLTDANLLPTIETADLLEHLATKPYANAPAIPEAFRSLDPIAVLNPDDVRTIGGLARAKVEGLYERPVSYTREEMERLLDPDTPRYFYPKHPSFLKRIRRGREPEESGQPEDGIHRIATLLQDPHSPALHRNGIRGVLLENVGLYKAAAAHFADADKRPEHLKASRSDENGQPSHLWQVGFVAGNILLAGLLRGGRKPRDIAGHAIAGSATALAVYGGLIAGGNITNSFGHGGKHPVRSVFTGRTEVLDDGTYTSNAPALSLPTLDEVGGQYWHHKHPEWIAYTPEKGWRKWAQAPFGSMLEALANRNIGMRPGPGFDLKPGELRPDVPSEAVLKLQEARARTIQQQKAAGVL